MVLLLGSITMDEISAAINDTLRSWMIGGIKYEKVEGQIYEMRRFEEEELISYLNRLVPVKHSVYDFVEYDSEVEKRFAEQRSEEHTSELQSRGHLVCRLLLEKKKKYITHI